MTVKRSVKAVGAVAAGAAFGVGAMGGVAHAASQATGKSCFTYYDINLNPTGTRCVNATVFYNAYDGTRNDIYSYHILYTVTGTLSYGPHNNENYAKLTSGWAGLGNNSYASPDSGPTGTSIDRSNCALWNPCFTDDFGYKGQEVFSIEAVPDIPNNPDDVHHINTATW